MKSTMKEIKILKLAMQNFKCHRDLTLDFSGKDVAIYGDNATGKTSVYDALTWLLFSKDSRGNGEKNLEIKPLRADGEVKDHFAVTSVEAVLLTDGIEISLKRTYQEIWTTKRGSSEQFYDGNTSEYYIDGVPVKKYVFSEKVDSLVDEDTFRMLTSVSHFSEGISWQERRAVLFHAASIMEDIEIMATDERFIPLMNSMGRLEVDDYKKKLLAEKRGFVGAKNEIPARISECEKTVSDIEAIDFAAARASVERLSVQREDLVAQLVSLERGGASEEKRIELRSAQLDLEAIENENKAFRASQSVGAPDVQMMKQELSKLQLKLGDKKSRLAIAEGSVGSYDKDIAASRERWISTNAEKFGGGNCPTCGQVLPEAQLKAATDAFEAQKNKRLREIEQTANARKEAKAQTEARIAEIKEEMTQLEADIALKESEICSAEAAIVEPVDMPDYAAKKASAMERINVLSGELADVMASTANVRSDLNMQISRIKGEIAVQNEIISRESLLEYSRGRIEELREDARNAAQCLEAIESMLFLIDEFTRYKTRFVEDRINALFKIARFRLFREQANGGIEDRCDVVYEGVPYSSLNNGARINVGIDIINTLSRTYGVSVPLFIDNAESVTKIEPSDTQVIRLVVSENDKELRTSYEN